MNETVPSSLSIFDIFDRMAVLVDAGRFDLCGEWLRRVDMDLLDERHTLSFLQATYEHRNDIPGREAFADRARTHLLDLLHKAYEEKPEIEKSPAPRTLSREEVRELMREGEISGREIEARFTRMERIDPVTAAVKAR